MNILLMVADDLAHYGVGLKNNGLPITPHLDELASKGIWFTQATSAGMMCKPGRTSLLTSLWPHQHGQLTNSVFLDPGTGEPRKFLPAELAAGGFSTTGFGKWHSPFTPAEAGFQAYMGAQDATWNTIISHLDSLGSQPQPWFLYLSFHEPHRPWWPKPTALAAYDGVVIPQRGNVNVPRVNKPVIQDALETRGNQLLADDGFDPADPDTILRYYYAMVSTLDWRVGQVLKRIKQQGLAQDTLIVFTTDQGQMLQNHSISFKGPMIYDEMVRIPILLRWPGVADSGTDLDEVFEIVDVAPTLLDAVGLPVPARFRGTSVAPALQGQPFTWKDFSISQTFLEPPGSGHLRCLRKRPQAGQDQWKIGLYDSDLDELYNLTQDPFELVNEAQSNPARYQLLRQELLQWMADNQDTQPAP